MRIMRATAPAQLIASRQDDQFVPVRRFEGAAESHAHEADPSASLDCEQTLDFELQVTEVDGTAIARCGGRVVYGRTARCFCVLLSAVITRYSRVVLDLRGITQLDACGLGTLAMLIQQAGGLHGRLVLSPTTNRIGWMLRITRLDTQIRHVTSNEIGAIA